MDVKQIMKQQHEITDAELERELLSPPKTFKGSELWPWSRAARASWYMVIDNERDLDVFQALSMVWILGKKGGSTASEDSQKVVVPAIYGDRNQFRAMILDWYNDLTDEEAAEAMRIRDEIVQAEYASRSTVQGEPGEKKQ